MNRHGGEECAALVDKCKHEAKQLVEFTATRRKIHWTHPSFISFCVSVEDILSFEVHSKFHVSKGRGVTSSGRVIQELGKTFPEAASVFNRCFEGSPSATAGTGGSREDYAQLQSGSPAERKVLWIRVALVDGKLQAIVEQLMKKPRSYYTERSVLCHPVYGEIFQYLIDGPCAIRYSRLKTSDASMSNPSPAEIVQRHNQVLSIAASKGQSEENGVAIATEQAWDHVQSLYQHSSSTCLFGKNNILVKPAGFSEPVQGYLTLQQELTGLILKWIPNSLLKDASNASSSLWNHVLSVEIVSHIAHIHCHRTPGKSAEMILIGYDGIAFPPILFPHQPSLFMFLECLENSLLPQGCLEPPLWYIKTHATRNKSQSTNFLRSLGSPKHSSSKRSLAGRSRSSSKASRSDKIDPSELEEGEREWYESMEVWNQVFRIRYSSKTQNGTGPPTEEEGPVIKATPPLHVRTLPLHLTPYSPSADALESSESGSEVEEDDLSPLEVTVEKPGSLARKDWEKFQLKVSKQLLARYFYSWLSYCRHMIKVRASVAHMVSTDVMLPGDHTHRDTPLSEAEWSKFIGLPAAEQKSQWSDIIKTIYHHGVEHSLRRTVWPYVLGVFPIGCSDAERESLVSQIKEDYQAVLQQWKVVDLRQKEMQIRAALVTNGCEETRSPSPTLSSISADSSAEPSPTPSPKHVSNATGQTLNRDNVTQSPKRSHDSRVKSHDPEVQLGKPHLPLDAKGEWFVRELFNIDKDIPRCDREYWYFKEQSHLIKVRNVVCSYVWTHMSEGYSQGMCDLLAPLMVVLDDEPLAYACYLKLMESAIKLFPPNTGMNTRLANVQALLQVNEPDYFQYLSERPMGDGLFYCYRWLLVCFKREFNYNEVFLLWETIWAARLTVTQNFEEFLAIAIMKQFKMAIMDAHLDPSDILNLFTDLAEKNAIRCKECIHSAQQDIVELQSALTKKDC